MGSPLSWRAGARLELTQAPWLFVEGKKEEMQMELIAGGGKVLGSAGKQGGEQQSGQAHPPTMEFNGGAGDGQRSRGNSSKAPDAWIDCTFHFTTWNFHVFVYLL